uniref:ZP domain-containing protein n=1 Tax=Macrostomum lignano TaxID=282301 RepID=A0A1I8GUA1_9PLAT
MLFQSIRFAVSISILMTVATVGAEDQHCIDKPVRNISVEIGDENPQRVMTYIRDEPGYQVNLRCKWTLQPANYDNPRQMYIRVPVIDFDTNDVSYKLALEFRSDDKQVRSNAKGVQVDVQVLGRDYCHRTMLFFEGSCYLITPEIAAAEAFSISKNYLGNVFTVPKNRNDSDFFRPFVQRNSDRGGEFPFESPLSLVGRKMWTGYFVDLPAQSPVNGALFMNPAKKCCQERRNMTVSTINQAVESVCAVAMVITSGSRVNFTCESLSSKLPALIEFKQIPATKGDTHPQLFTTCDTMPEKQLDTSSAPTRTVTTAEPQSTKTVIVIVVVVLFVAILIAVIVVAIVIFFKRRANPQSDGQTEAETPAGPEKVPLNARGEDGEASQPSKTDPTQNLGRP